jgi:hypothetical protein
LHFHDHYKELFALALSGQLVQVERKELEDHLSTCAECRTEVGDFAQITANFPRIADDRQLLAVPPGLTERILARARSEGIPLSRKGTIPTVRKRPKQFRLAWFAAVAALAVVAAGYSIVRALHSSPTRIVALLPEARRLAPAASPLSGPAQDSMLEENADLKGQIQRLRNDLSALSARVQSDQAQLKAAEADKRALSARLSDAAASEAGLRKGVTNYETEVGRLNSELEQAQATKDAQAVALKVEESELNTLHEEMAKLDMKLRESEQLSEIANEAKDIVVARKLHIIDVDDTDENGKRQRPFGRIFYTEGKTLKFYAYDLADPRKLNAKTNFYVWGSKEGDTKTVKSLGIFHSDDVKDQRWVLRFTDPNVLAQIDCVFVTAEPAKNAVTQPTGKQILFASLGKTNHP